jgi:hypothetical protein
MVLTAFAALLLAALPAPARAEVVPPGAPPLGKIYALASSPANCVDLAGDIDPDGQPILAYTCHNADNQQWSYETFTNTIHSGIQDPNRRLCIGIGGDTISNGSPIEIFDCDGSGSQVWRIIGQSLYNPQSGRCLDDPSGQIGQLQIWDCNFGGNANQNWDIVGYNAG